MKKRNPKPDDGPRPSEQFKRFEQTMRRLLAVSKQELDELRAVEQSKKRQPKTEPSDRSL
jgi:hypothetical protein